MLQWLNLKGMDEVVIFGASGHGKVIIDIFKRMEDCIPCLVVDDDPKSELFCSVKLEKRNKENVEGENLIIAIGNNRIRKKISQELLSSKFVKAIHPTAVIDETVQIEEGTVVMANVTINVDTKIGRHCIVNTASVIDHDCELEDYVHISPNASLAGDVKVGEGTQVGIGACVIQGVRIGKNVMIGAGAVIVRNVPDDVVVVGNPGRVIKKNKI